MVFVFELPRQRVAHTHADARTQTHTRTHIEEETREKKLPAPEAPSKFSQVGI